MRRYQLALFFCLFLASFSSLQSAPPATTEAAKRPQTLTAKVGDVRIRIDGPKLWTLSGFDYQDQVVAVEDSAYGSVLNLKGVGILGSAHFLDIPGKPGLVEKEQVTALRFFCDDVPLTEITPQMTVAAKSFRMERESTIRSIHLASQVTLSNNILTESVRLKATQTVDLTVSYPLMYAWSPTMTHYLFGDEKGIQKRGQFLSPPAKAIEGLERTAKWMAVYDSQSNTGAVCYLQNQPGSEEVWLQYTDAPSVYRKLRIMCFSDKAMPAGFDGTYQVAIAFFTAKQADWEATAQTQMRELQSLATIPK